MKKHFIFPSILAFCGVMLLGLSELWQPAPVLVWNASASVPKGLYHVVSGVPKHGDYVLVRTPKPVAALADRRHYLPLNVPLIKRVAAMARDRICVSKQMVSINGEAVAQRFERDSKGRLLPVWSVCQRLKEREYFLLADAKDSFDSRYFGAVSGDHIIGRLEPLWTD